MRTVYSLKWYERKNFPLEEAIDGCNMDSSCGCFHYNPKDGKYYLYRRYLLGNGMYLATQTRDNYDGGYGFEAWVSLLFITFICIYTNHDVEIIFEYEICFLSTKMKKSYFFTLQ